MSRGTIRRRGKASWEIKFDAPSEVPGKRATKYVTVKGKKADAQRELTRLLAQADGGTLVEPSKTPVRDYLRSWLDGRSDLAQSTRDRYRDLIEAQIVPHLGNVPMQKLRPQHIAEWHKMLLKSGGWKGRPLGARTVGHAHRVLHAALESAVKLETLSRNVASVVSPPKVQADEIEILDSDQVAFVLAQLEGNRLYPIVALALATGLRRSEILALRLCDIDLQSNANPSLRVERSAEEARDGTVTMKEPKSKAGKRTIRLATSTVEMLRKHRRELLQQRLMLGLGRPDGDTLLFANHDGTPWRPSNLSITWGRTCTTLGLPDVSFHALRHTHASALIAAKVDIVRISKRLGHASPTVTLNVYAHLFDTDDSEAAEAIDAMMAGPKREH